MKYKLFDDNLKGIIMIEYLRSDDVHTHLEGYHNYHVLFTVYLISLGLFEIKKKEQIGEVLIFIAHLRFST